MAHFSFLTVLLKSVLSKPATRRYPFEKREPFAATRGHIEIDVNTCTFCTLCQKKCPTQAIEVKRVERIWEINRLRCIQCNACVDSCPKKCLTMKTTYSPAVVTKDKAIDTFVGPPKPAPTEKTETAKV